MASAHRCTFSSPISADAVIRTVDGQQVACWVDRKGQKVAAPILANGKCQRTAPGRWYGTYRDHNGKQKKTTTFGSKTHALEAAIRLERKATAVKEGRESPDRPTGKVLLIDLVDDYTTALRVKGTGEKWAGRVNAELRRLIAQHNLRYAGGVDAEKLANRLEMARQAGPPEGEKGHGEPYSLRTRNKWVVSLRGMGRWLVKTKRSVFNPFESLATVNAEVDRRLERRPITLEQFDTLVTAARRSPDVVQWLNGPDRAMLYTLAAYTGLRAGALLKLTPEAFAWEDGVPVGVYSSARIQKNKSAHAVRLATPIRAAVGQWLAPRTPGVPIFTTVRNVKTAAMLRHDLATAGIPFRDAVGRVFDFHSLRIMTAFLLFRGGASLPEVQQVLDHSTPVLTANIYAKFGGHLGDTMDRMPSLSAASLGTRLGTEPLQTPPKVRKPVNKKPGGKKKKPRKS